MSLVGALGALLLVANVPAGLAVRGLSLPVNRASVFRVEGYTDFREEANRHDCGNYHTQYMENEGKCGVCGDNYALDRPRPNEHGGKFGRGIIVQTYQAGSNISVIIETNMNSYGFFDFALCPMAHPEEPLWTGNRLETEECFAAHKLRLAQTAARYEYEVTDFQRVSYTLGLRLPRNLTCRHCVLRWQFTGAYPWPCKDGTASPDCGNQEVSRTCSDIRIQ
ncbi:uncharacterized protein [Venturia canescens]|uniref:uncharacterized protein n=1 Tax=Venturia canescens TaxID=32260 RepID=UPI001C9BDB92|nr:uncharacterized protein LOC122417346 [Venturia canescens]